MNDPMPPDMIAGKLAILRDVRRGSRIGSIDELQSFRDGIIAQGYAVDGEVMRAIEEKRKILTQGR
jgi:hypothetical protein